MIAGDDDDPCLRQHLPQPLELKEGVQYGRIRRTHGVKNITCNQHEIWLQLDDLVYYALQRPRDVVLPLIQAGGSLSLILSETEVYVCEVNQSHRTRIALIHCVIFVRTCIGERCASPLRPGADAIVDRTMMLLLESVIQPSRRSI